MQTDGTKRRFASIAAVALLAFAVVPALAGSASAATVASGAHPAASASADWAFGGSGSVSASASLGGYSLSYGASIGAAVIYNATPTGLTTTELTASRTVALTISLSLTTPNASVSYNLKAVEVDHAYANVTNASSVTLGNGSVVPALGLLNASLHATVSLQASLAASNASGHASDNVNVSGWANSQVQFTPALGLIPLNLSGVTDWGAVANASGSAAWNITWAYADHGWNGTNAAESGYISGTWSKAATVVLIGHVAGTYDKWVDHKLRTAIGLALAGPFDLYAGVVLVPHSADLFGTANQNYTASGVGSTAVTSEYLYVANGPRYLSVESVSAGNMTAGNSTLGLAVPAESTGGHPLATTSTSTTPTAWEQPESPSAAQQQAYCLQFGCPGSSNPWAGLLVPLAVVGVAAVVAIGLLLSRRPRNRAGQTVDVPLSAQFPNAPAPPSGVEPNGPVPPPQ
jgi:hypothetical protein